MKNENREEILIKLFNEKMGIHSIRRRLKCDIQYISKRAIEWDIEYLKELVFPNKEKAEKIKYLIEQTNTPLNKIAAISKYKDIYPYIHKIYDKKFLKERKTKLYSISKKGINNPMLNKKKEKHHNYKGEIGDGGGYLMRLKPEWYTGRKKQNHVFSHHIVICEALKITEIPKGFVVHHIDGDRHNNKLGNLALLSNAAHSTLHGQLRKLNSIISKLESAETNPDRE